jgi:hypothetical protein
MNESISPKEIEDMGIKTLNAIFRGHREKVKRLYGRVEMLFVNGNEFTRSLIANKFIFPLAQLLEMNYSWGREYLNLFPQQLKAEYCRQVNCSGI